MKKTKILLDPVAAGQGTSGAKATSIVTAVATASAGAFARALSAIQIIKQQNDAISMAVSSAVSQVCIHRLSSRMLTGMIDHKICVTSVYMHHLRLYKSE